jgi:hypothetical protein
MESFPVIKGYYLVIGGGKIGTDFLRYASKNKFPFVLVIDRDENAPVSKEAKVLKTVNELVTLLRNKALLASSEDKADLSRVDNESEIYFYKMGMHRIPSLFTFGIPEYIIPAVPCHAVAYILSDFLKLHNQELSTNEVREEKSPVKELYIRSEDSQLSSFFEDIAAAFPEDVIAGRYPEQGILFFSYAEREKSVRTAAPVQATTARPLGGKSRKQLRNTQGNCG